MKGSLKTLATLALGLAAMSPTTETVKAQNGQTISVRGKEQIKQPVRSARQIVREDAGGLEVIGYNPGIPPKIYGQHYVRKGTHKRTNKKK